MTIGHGSFLSELVERAGGRNLFDDVTASAGTVSIEAVASRDPDLILTAAEGPASFISRPEWQVVRAVRERRLHSGERLRVQPARSPVAGGDPGARRADPRGGAVSRTRIALLLLAVAACLTAGLSAGTVPLSPREIWAGLGSADAPASVIVRELRAPRVLLAFLVGGSLGICGAALQAMIRNPLAEPYLLGLSGGAGLGAVLAIATRAAGPWAVPVAAFVGALGAVALVYRLSLVAGRRLDPRVLLLSGSSSARSSSRS